MKTITLQTRCPHCQTLFEILEIQLRAASGQARCSCCDNIFNAKKNLIQSKPTEPPQNSIGTISLNGLFDEIETEETTFPEFSAGIRWTDTGSHEDHAAGEKYKEPRKPVFPPDKSRTDGGAITAQNGPSYADILFNRQLDLAAAESVTSEPAEEPAPPTRQQMTGIDEEIEQGLFSNGSKQGGRPILWAAAVLCLLATALIQIAWLSPDSLKSYPEVRKLLELVCTRAGCEPPPWHEPERFKISSRSVNTHPKNSRALQIQLVFSNAARFAQSYPPLQLRLYDTNEKLSAQRVFSPEEYLAEPKSKTNLVQPAQSVAVDMALADPGIGITGFKIEFL